jgi:Flp pilus assembly protein TadG
MLVVIALLLLLLTFVYLPYAHYQEKLKVRQAVREVSQSIIEVRNLAINGIDMKEDENDPNSLYENKSV